MAPSQGRRQGPWPQNVLHVDLAGLQPAGLAEPNLALGISCDPNFFFYNMYSVIHSACVP